MFFNKNCENIFFNLKIMLYICGVHTKSTFIFGLIKALVGWPELFHKK